LAKFRIVKLYSNQPLKAYVNLGEAETLEQGFRVLLRLVEREPNLTAIVISKEKEEEASEG